MVKAAVRSGGQHGRWWALVLAAGLIVAVSWPAGVLAEEGEGQPGLLALDDVPVEEHPLVSVTVTAPGHFVDDVPITTFTVIEEGVPRDFEVQRIASDDLEVVLALDNSGSMGVEPMEAVKSAALSFVDRMPPAVRLVVLEFNTEAVLLTEFTSDRTPVRSAIEGLHSDGYTALFDAVQKSVAAFDWDEQARRVIVLVAMVRTTSARRACPRRWRCSRSTTWCCTSWSR